MVITSSRLANGTPSLITKWRTRVARTQLEFTARDHEFTSEFTRSMECYFIARELVITRLRVEWNAAEKMNLSAVMPMTSPK